MLSAVCAIRTAGIRPRIAERRICSHNVPGIAYEPSASLLRQPRLTFADVGWPAALDVREHGPDLVGGQGLAESRHVALVAFWRVGGDAVARDLEQHLVRVVPCMATRIVRRRRQTAVRLTLAPVRLPLQVGPVARRALRRIDGMALRHLRGIVRIGASMVRAHVRPDGHGDDDQPDRSREHAAATDA